MPASLLRFLALGDSYTIGEGVEPDGRWPVQLAGLLRAAGLPLAGPEIVATTGWTTAELEAAIDRAAPRGPYDLVTLLIGVNNQYRGRPLDEYREQFAGLLRRAVGLAGGKPARVLVLSIPDWSVTPFAEGRDRAAVAAEIDAFNAVAAAICAAAAVTFVDVTAISRQAARNPGLVAGDGLHPSAAMYRRWAELVLPLARRALELA